MDAVGKLIEVSEVASGQSSTGNTWMKIGFAIQVKEKNIKKPKQLYFDSFANEVIEFISNTSVGTILRITYDVSSRKWNDRWFTGATAYSVEVLKENDNVVTNQDDMRGFADEIADKHLKRAANILTNPVEEESGSDDDLPF